MIALLALCGQAFAGPSSWWDWEHGAAGHRQAQEAAERSGDPLVVYFHADWCPWCKKLNERYLRSGSVESALDGMEKVEMSPEKGGSEEALFERYGATGYPSVYVLVPGSGQSPDKLSPFRGGKEQPVDDFAQSIRKAAASQYSRWAHRLEGSGNDDRAMRMLEKALALDSRNFYPHYLQGVILHKKGHQERDKATLRRAKAAYQRALELDPGHGGSRKGLKALADL